MIQKLITDQNLKSAATLVRSAMLESFPAETELQFTPSFTQRIDAMREAERTRVRHLQTRKRIIAAAVALLLAVSMLLSLNPDVRAAVQTWFKEVFAAHTDYRFAEKPIDTLPECVLTQVPTGYELVMEDITEFRKAFIYQNVDNPSADIPFDGFSFEYGILNSSGHLSVGFPTDKFNAVTVSINGLPGDLYISLTAEETHGLLWIDEENGVYYSISAYFDPKQILALAQAVELQE